MINFRFHLISLVAVFLALGVGVAMGASFIDRATVDSLRGRVDDLDAGFRERGEQIDALDQQLTQQDLQAAALADPGSEAIATRLRGQPVVLVVPDDLSGELLDLTRASLAAADAEIAGSVRLLPALSLDDEGTVRRVRDALGIRSGDVDALQARVVDDLGTALGLLGAGAAEGADGPEGEGAGEGAVEGTTTSTTATTAPVGDGFSGTALTDADAARAYLAALDDLGLISVEPGDVPAGATFPAAGPFRYVEVLGPEEAVDTDAVMVPLAEALSAESPLTLTVAFGDEVRGSGEATTTTAPEGSAAGLQQLRSGDAAGRLSTVDDLQESFGRIALVYAVAQQRDDRSVGHYGTAPGATGPFPTVPPG